MQPRLDCSRPAWTAAAGKLERSVATSTWPLGSSSAALSTKRPTVYCNCQIPWQPPRATARAERHQVAPRASALTSSPGLEEGAPGRSPQAGSGFQHTSERAKALASQNCELTLDSSCASTQLLWIKEQNNALCHGSALHPCGRVKGLVGESIPRFSQRS